MHASNGGCYKHRERKFSLVNYRLLFSLLVYPKLARMSYITGWREYQTTHRIKFWVPIETLMSSGGILFSSYCTKITFLSLFIDICLLHPHVCMFSYYMSIACSSQNELCLRVNKFIVLPWSHYLLPWSHQRHILNCVYHSASLNTIVQLIWVICIINFIVWVAWF